MVGSDVLVAPVIKDGMRIRGVYLPARTTHYIDAPLGSLPIFVGAGAVIPTQTVIQHTGEMKDAVIKLNAIGTIPPGKTGILKLYQDLGEGYGYRNGPSQDLQIKYSQNSFLLNRSGDFKGQKISSVEFVGLSGKPSGVRVNGVKMVDEPVEILKRKRYRVKIDEQTKEILWK